MKFLATFLFLCVILHEISANTGKIVRLRLESCPGCSLNRLSEVKQFFYEDVPKYEQVEWKKIGGAKPEAFFLDENDQVVEQHQLSSLTRKECNDLLQSKGFKMTDKENDSEQKEL